MSEVSVKDLTQYIAVAQKHVDQKDRELKELKADLQEKKNQLMLLMEELGQDSFKNEYGNFVINRRFTVKKPQTPEQWERFWAYLKERGHYDEMVTINSQKLNGWYKQELESAKARGDIDWHCPGLDEPKVNEYITVRKV